MKIAAWIILGFLAILTVTTFMKCSSNGANTVYTEFSPSALLKKYEQFKDLSAAIDKKRADIEMYRVEIESVTVESKEDKEYLLMKKNELIGIISVHNSLCSEYNAKMSKFNYRFTNVGDLPYSNAEPLPREIKPYILSLK